MGVTIQKNPEWDDEVLMNVCAQIAADAHRGQTDIGGNKYLIHLSVVALMQSTVKEACVGFLHDILEDTHITVPMLLEKGIPIEIVDSVRTLTRSEDDDYEEYIERVKKDKLARRVKLADLTHNMDASRLNRKLKKRDLKRRIKYHNARKTLASKEEILEMDKKYIHIKGQFDEMEDKTSK